MKIFVTYCVVLVFIFYFFLFMLVYTVMPLFLWQLLCSASMKSWWGAREGAPLAEAWFEPLPRYRHSRRLRALRRDLACCLCRPCRCPPSTSRPRCWPPPSSPQSFSRYNLESSIPFPANRHLPPLVFTISRAEIERFWIALMPHNASGQTWLTVYVLTDSHQYLS